MEKYKILIVSGPTMEPLDPVRYISNHSSGKTGFYLAESAKKRGFEEIYYISGPTLHYPDKVNLYKVKTALEMYEKALELYSEVDIIIMVAAVCDYRPKNFSEIKLKKKEAMTLELVKNPDILKELGMRKKEHQVLLGFAAETNNGIQNAKGKLINKKADFIVLNEINEENPVFAKDRNKVSFIDKQGVENLQEMSKQELAFRIIDKAIRILKKRK